MDCSLAWKNATDDMLLCTIHLALASMHKHHVASASGSTSQRQPNDFDQPVLRSFPFSL